MIFLVSLMTLSRLAGVPATTEYVGLILFNGQASLSPPWVTPISPKADLKSMVASLSFPSLPNPLPTVREGCTTELSLLLKSVIRLQCDWLREGVERLRFFHCFQRRGTTTGRELHIRAQTTMAAERMRKIETPSTHWGMISALCTPTCDCDVD